MLLLAHLHEYTKLGYSVVFQSLFTSFDITVIKIVEGKVFNKTHSIGNGALTDDNILSAISALTQTIDEEIEVYRCTPTFADIA